MTCAQWHHFFTTGLASAVLTLFASHSEGAPRFDEDFRIVAAAPSGPGERPDFGALHALIPQPAEEEPLPPQF